MHWIGRKLFAQYIVDEKLFLLNNVFAVQIVQNNIKDAVYTAEIYKHIP